MDYQSSRLTATYLRSRKIPSTACSGCGLGMNHKIVVQAISEVGLGVADVVWGTSIGCAGRQTFATWKGDGFAGTHGRVYAIARGLRIAMAPEKKIGTYALRSDPSLKPQPYMGLELTHDINLAGAGAEDKIVFFVKQNFGSGICVNMRTPKGNVYRYVKVTHEQWSRVEVDLDLAKWSQDNKVPVTEWSKVTYLHIYAHGFDKAGEYMLMDGFSVFKGGQPVVTRPKREPAKE